MRLFNQTSSYRSTLKLSLVSFLPNNPWLNNQARHNLTKSLKVRKFTSVPAQLTDLNSENKPDLEQKPTIREVGLAKGEGENTSNSSKNEETDEEKNPAKGASCSSNSNIQFLKKAGRLRQSTIKSTTTDGEDILELQNLIRKLHYQPAGQSPSQLPRFGVTQTDWTRLQYSLLACLKYPSPRRRLGEELSNLFQNGDSLLLMGMIPGLVYFLEELLFHMAHSIDCDIVSMDIQDIQSLGFVDRAFRGEASLNLPVYPDARSLGGLSGFSHSNSNQSSIKKENEEDEGEEDEDEENEDDDEVDGEDVRSSSSNALYKFATSEGITFVTNNINSVDSSSSLFTSEEIVICRKLRNGFGDFINKLLHHHQSNRLIINFKDVTSSLLDRSSYLLIRSLYQAIQDCRLSDSNNQLTLTCTLSPSTHPHPASPLAKLFKHNPAHFHLRLMDSINRSPWARHFLVQSVFPRSTNSNHDELQPKGLQPAPLDTIATQVMAWWGKRTFEVNFKNLSEIMGQRGIQLQIHESLIDDKLKWASSLHEMGWTRSQLTKLATVLIGYGINGNFINGTVLTLTKELVEDSLSLSKATELTNKENEATKSGECEKEGNVDTDAFHQGFLHFDRDLSSLLAHNNVKHNDKDNNGYDASSKLETIKRSCDSYERKLFSCIVNPNQLTVGFEDIRIQPETITTLQNLITLPLLRPDWFNTGVLAKHFISGVLLFGPPGTGKTLLAKAVAKQSGSFVLEIKGSDVYNKYVGEGEKTVQAIFKLARKLKPCVIFIDEVDALFGARRNELSGNGGRREIINQFMAEWDGLTSSNKGVMIMAATNRPFDLDDAILRRMPRRILVDLPNILDREFILSLHLKDEVLDEKVDLKSLARQTEGYSGSDLKNLCVSAAIAALQDLVKLELGSNIDSSGIIDLRKLLKPYTPPISAISDPNSSVFSKRVLTKDNFECALRQINASISDEMGSVIELRKWDSQYGDAARSRAKRKINLGFGHHQPKTLPPPSL